MPSNGLRVMTSHIPNHGDQMVRYYGFYSNVSRGLREKENENGLLPLPNMNKFFDLPHLTWSDLFSSTRNR